MVAKVQSLENTPQLDGLKYPGGSVWGILRIAGTMLLTALLFEAALCRLEVGFLAWISLIPFLSILEGVSPRKAWLIGFWQGLFIFVATVWWMGHVAFLAAVGLIIYLALYVACFAWAYRSLGGKSLIGRMCLGSALWVIVEFVRARGPFAFDWASLGHTQVRQLYLLQIVDMTGVFGLSFLVMMGNIWGMALWKYLCSLCKRSIQSSFCINHREIIKGGMLLLALLGVVVGYGELQLSRWAKAEEVSSYKGLDVAMVQANIPQAMKWNPTARGMILTQYEILSEEVARTPVDLIVWPETSFPEMLGKENAYFGNVEQLAQRLQTPLLVGATREVGSQYYNSAILISAQGRRMGTYDKTHLVPYGEYVPLRQWFPDVAEWIPIADFSSGRINAATLLSLPFVESVTLDGSAEIAIPFAVLICFEDTLAPLARALVQFGATFLVNMTNDAWFGYSPAPWMHMQSSVFRSVETRKFLVRAANTGVSGIVHPTGQILNVVKNAQGRSINVAGAIQGRVYPNTYTTFYTKFGDVFTSLCFSGILATVLWSRYKKRYYKNNHV